MIMLAPEKLGEVDPLQSSAARRHSAHRSPRFVRNAVLLLHYSNGDGAMMKSSPWAI